MSQALPRPAVVVFDVNGAAVDTGIVKQFVCPAIPLTRAAS